MILRRQLLLHGSPGDMDEEGVLDGELGCWTAEGGCAPLEFIEFVG